MSGFLGDGKLKLQNFKYFRLKACNSVASLVEMILDRVPVTPLTGFLGKAQIACGDGVWV